MGRIKGIDIELIEQTKVGTDPFGAPIHSEEVIIIKNVLVGQPSTDDIQNSLNLHGKKVQYILGIPKGDNHKWEDARVRFFNQEYRTFGFVTQGIEDMMPLEWNKKVMVEAYA